MLGAGGPDLSLGRGGRLSLAASAHAIELAESGTQAGSPPVRDGTLAEAFELRGRGASSWRCGDVWCRLRLRRYRACSRRVLHRASGSPIARLSCDATA